MEVTLVLLAAVRFACALLVLAVSLSVPAQAAADTNEDARAAFLQGVAAAQQEHWQEAREHFKRSAELLPKPSTLVNLAVVEVRLGLPKDALATLEKFQQLPASAEYPELRERAEALRQTIKSQLEVKRDEKVLPELINVEGLEGEAAALFQAGRQAHWSGRYEQALEYFQEAHQLSQRPELLYDVAAAADRSRKNDQIALSSLERFLAESPGSPLAGAVTARVKVLKQVIATTPPPDDPEGPPPQPPPPAAKRERSPREKRAIRLIWAGAALEAGAVGTYFYWRNRKDNLSTCLDAGDECENATEIRDE
jgi:tetratricopeptide (TPR) repeat protein